MVVIEALASFVHYRLPPLFSLPLFCPHHLKQIVTHISPPTPSHVTSHLQNSRTPDHYSLMIARLGLNTLLPYHGFIFAVSFGGSFFYSFIVSPLVFKKLPRQQFSDLQLVVFPTYFLGQIAAPALLALTTPVRFCPFHYGLLALSSVGGLLNYFWLLPKCAQIKEARNKVSEDSAEYKLLLKQFGKYHGLSTLANIVSIVLLGTYGLLWQRGLVKSVALHP